MSEGISGGDLTGTNGSQTVLPGTRSTGAQKTPAKYRSRTIGHGESPSPSTPSLPNQTKQKELNQRRVTQKGNDGPDRIDLTPHKPLRQLNELTHKIEKYAERYWGQEKLYVFVKEDDRPEEQIVTRDFGSEPMTIADFRPVAHLLQPTLQLIKQLPADSWEAKKLERLISAPMLGIPFKDWDSADKVEACLRPSQTSTPAKSVGDSEDFISRCFSVRLDGHIEELLKFHEDFLENYVNDKYDVDSDEYRMVMYGGDEGSAEFLRQHGKDVMATLCKQYEEQFDSICTSEVLSFLKANRHSPDSIVQKYLDVGAALLDLMPEAILEQYGVSTQPQPAARLFEEDIRSMLTEEFDQMQADMTEQQLTTPVEFGVSKREYGAMLMQRLITMRATLMFESGLRG